MATYLITGANRGLGLEFARQYAAAGDHVYAACRQPSDALTALARDNPAVEILGLDVADPGAIARLAERLTGKVIDVLINNAGIYGPRNQSADNVDPAAWAQVFAVNTMAPLQILQALRPNLALAKAPKAVTVTSRMGSITETGGGFYAYRSSKAALNMVMRNLAVEMKGSGLTIAVLHPGWVRTDMGGPNATLAPPESVSGMRKVIAGLTTADSGSFFNYDGAILPW